jgi:hypothetical protein
VPTTVPYSPDRAESNGTTLAAVAQSVVLADSDAPSMAVDHSTAIASCTLIITQLRNQTSLPVVPITVLYSPDHVESNGTSLVAVAESVALGVVEAPTIGVDHSSAMPNCHLIVTQLRNQTPIPHVPTIVRYSPDHVESKGTSLVAVAQLVALADSDAPSIEVDHSAAITSCIAIIT